MDKRVPKDIEARRKAGDFSLQSGELAGYEVERIRKEQKEKNK